MDSIKPISEVDYEELLDQIAFHATGGLDEMIAEEKVPVVTVFIDALRKKIEEHAKHGKSETMRAERFNISVKYNNPDLPDVEYTACNDYSLSLNQSLLHIKTGDTRYTIPLFNVIEIKLKEYEV